MSQLPVRSLRLQKKSSQSLDTLNGNSGELFYDSDNRALRLYTGDGADKIIFASRTWVLNNTFSGNYNDLTNKPVFADIAFSGDYNDLINTPVFSTNLVDLNDVSIQAPLDIGQGIVWNGITWSNQTLSSNIADLGDVNLTSPISSDQVLLWNGSNWTNSDIASVLDTNTTYSVSAVSDALGAAIDLVGSDGSSDKVVIAAGSNITVTQTDSNTITITAAVGSLAINDLSDVDTTSIAPQTGQVLKWNGVNWVPADDVTSGGTGLDADTLDGFDGSYYLDYNNFTNTPTIPTDLTDLGILDGSDQQVLTTNGAGAFSFQTLTIPTALTDLGISDGTVGQVLTTDGAGNFTFEDAAGGTADLGLLTITLATIATSTGDPITLDENVTANGNLSIFGSIETVTVDAPEVYSTSTLDLNAATRVQITASPFKLASFTDTERDLLTAENGDMIYNTTVNKFQGYQNGAWINLDGTV